MLKLKNFKLDEIKLVPLLFKNGGAIEANLWNIGFTLMPIPIFMEEINVKDIDNKFIKAIGFKNETVKKSILKVASKTKCRKIRYYSESSNLNFEKIAKYASKKNLKRYLDRLDTAVKNNSFEYKTMIGSDGISYQLKVIQVKSHKEICMFLLDEDLIVFRDGFMKYRRELKYIK